MADRGPIEAALSSPGFSLFWPSLLTSLRAFRDSLISESMEATKASQVERAQICLTRATAVDDVVSRLEPAPKNAIARERRASDPNPIDAGAGYGTL